MFYVLEKGWVAAGDLNNGDEIYLIDGSTAYVIGAELEKLAEKILVYNLEVADYNTYFVGDVPVLVHNYGPNNSKHYTPYDPNMPEEIHHIATNKNPYYTPEFEGIANKYGLNLDDDWNKITIPHRGTHPWEYHDFIWEQMIEADNKAKGNVNVILKIWNFVGDLLKENPQMLYTEFWRK